MKTQIIQLEAHDDYISVRDRMGWGQTTRVLLVWPLRAKILGRQLDLLLLKRYSEKLGSQLALVTRDREVRYHARQLNIPIYKSIREAEQSRWLQPRRKQQKSRTAAALQPRKEPLSKSELETLRAQAHPSTPRWLTHPLVRISFFTLGVLSMLLVAAVFIPSAKIYVNPASFTNSSLITVSANPVNKTVEISGAVPTYWQTVIVEGRGSIPASGRASIPRAAASGRVTFFNLTDEPLTVPAGTVVSTREDVPVRFATREAISIPPGAEGGLVWVDALLPGSAGNVGAEKIIAIEGSLGLNLTVVNRLGTSGGSDYNTRAPTASDYEALRTELLESLEETALSEAKLRLESGDVILSQAPSLIQTLEDQPTPEIGQPADVLELILRVEFQIPYAAGADLYQLGRIVLDRQIPPGFSARAETLQISQETAPLMTDPGEATWKIKAQWKLDAEIDERQAVSLALGLEPVEAAGQIEAQMPIEGPSVIKLSPTWWPRLPILPFRIQLISEP